MSSTIDNLLDAYRTTCQTVEGSLNLLIPPVWLLLHMKFDVTTLRALGRITDRMDLIRKNPHRYEIDAEVLTQLAAAARQVEELLAKVRTIKAG